MGLIDGIRDKIRENRYEFSKHAVDRMIQRHITVAEVREALDSGTIIEDYPEDKYGPSCPIFGCTIKDRTLHIQCSHPERPLLKIVTVYEPDPDEWDDFRVRKR